MEKEQLVNPLEGMIKVYSICNTCGIIDETGSKAGQTHIGCSKTTRMRYQKTEVKSPFGDSTFVLVIFEVEIGQAARNEMSRDRDEY